MSTGTGPDDLLGSWKQIAERELPLANFQNTLDQLRALEIPFVVRLVASAADPELGPWVTRIGTFLRSFGFDVVVHDEINTDTLIPLLGQSADIFLVWSTSRGLQDFCLSFVSEQSGQGRLIVCVPDGHDGEFYCRRLREKHHVETIALSRERLISGESCRFGLDLLLRCSDDLFRKVTVAEREARLRNTYVVLIHGIRTRALWQGPIHETLAKAGLLPWRTNYGKFDLIRFLQPLQRFRQKAIRHIEREIESLRGERPGAEVSVIAHSFGSYITSKLIEDGHRFKSVVFCGSVVPWDFDFSKAPATRIVNEIARCDGWPVLAEKFGVGYGATGTFGFNCGRVRDRVHAKLGHSTSLTRAFCDRFWIPFFCDGAIHESDEENAQPPLWISVLERIPSSPALNWLILLLVISFLVAFLIA